MKPNRKVSSKKSVSRKVPSPFWKPGIQKEKVGDLFYSEYQTILLTVEAVNNFSALYHSNRAGATGGPASHDQQDLYRAMLVFACAGLDVFVKRLVKSKLPLLLPYDDAVKDGLRVYVSRDIKEREGGITINSLALALIDPTPSRVFLEEYIESMTKDSLQSVEALLKIVNASGLDKDVLTGDKKGQIREAFRVRNEIIHEMDINIEPVTKTTGYRTRRQRRASEMEKHTKNILQFADDFYTAYKIKFEKYNIGTKKKQ